MQIDGSGVDLFGLFGLALLVNMAATLWAAGVAMRFRSIQGGPLMQMPVFLILFLAPVYVPLGPADGLDPRRRLGEPGHGAARGRPRVHLGPPDRGGRGLRGRARPCGAVRALGPRRAAQRRVHA